MNLGDFCANIFVSRCTSLKYWPILSFLPTDLANQVVQAFVFGCAGNEALVTLQSGDVYAFGFNGNGCLGIRDSSCTLEPEKVVALCQKVLIDIAYGSGPHVLAVTGMHKSCIVNSLDSSIICMR